MLPSYLIACSHGEHWGAVDTQGWQLYTSTYLLMGEGQQLGREMALLIHRAEGPIWAARRRKRELPACPAAGLGGKQSFRS